MSPLSPFLPSFPPPPRSALCPKSSLSSVSFWGPHRAPCPFFYHSRPHAADRCPNRVLSSLVLSFRCCARVASSGLVNATDLVTAFSRDSSLSVPFPSFPSLLTNYRPASTRPSMASTGASSTPRRPSPKRRGRASQRAAGIAPPVASRAPRHSRPWRPWRRARTR